jgi:hypothetical protein
MPLNDTVKRRAMYIILISLSGSYPGAFSNLSNDTAANRSSMANTLEASYTTIGEVFSRSGLFDFTGTAPTTVDRTSYIQKVIAIDKSMTTKTLYSSLGFDPSGNLTTANKKIIIADIIAAGYTAVKVDGLTTAQVTSIVARTSMGATSSTANSYRKAVLDALATVV